MPNFVHMNMRTYNYNKTASKYAEKLRSRGYQVKFNWTDPDSGIYEDVTVRGRIFRGYGGEFKTPRHAWVYINTVAL